MKVAIYSRKSVFTGKGESIENQIQMCKNYYLKIRSLNCCNFKVYEDEGYTGANIKRPEFQKLLSDIKNNEISVLICYRLDRVSRNVADFSSILEILQAHNVDFISIKEQFDTSTPIGKAMTYIASVFAQLERDTIAERVKDNMIELSKTGRWLGGQLPLGFVGEKITYFDDEMKEHHLHKLTPIPEELLIVKEIFNYYLDSKSISYVLKKLLGKMQKGKNGGEFSSVSIRDILRNPVYVKSNNYVREYLESKGILFCGIPNGCGIMLYNKKIGGKKLNPMNKWIASIGRHTGIISSSDWLRVQKSLDASSKKSSPYSIRLGTSKRAILTGVLKCAKCGSPMRVTYGKRRLDGTRNYYYTCTLKCHSGKLRCNNSNANGPVLELEIINFLINYDKTQLKMKLKYILNKQQSTTLNFNISEINKEINSLKSQINILINQISKTNNKTTQEFLLNKTDTLSLKLTNLKKALDKQPCKNDAIKVPTTNMDCCYNFESIYTYIDNLSYINDELRLSIKNLINNTIKKITFDGDTNNVVIYTITNNKT